MEANSIKIGENDLQVKEWNGQRVVTFKDIDKVHQRPDGTARKRFNDNKQHLLENIDYFFIKKIRSSNVRKTDIRI